MIDVRTAGLAPLPYASRYPFAPGSVTVMLTTTASTLAASVGNAALTEEGDVEGRRVGRRHRLGPERGDVVDRPTPGENRRCAPG